MRCDDDDGRDDGVTSEDDDGRDRRTAGVRCDDDVDGRLRAGERLERAAAASAAAAAAAGGGGGVSDAMSVAAAVRADIEGEGWRVMEVLLPR